MIKCSQKELLLLNLTLQFFPPQGLASPLGPPHAALVWNHYSTGRNDHLKILKSLVFD
jgi:hypothetical protein